MKSLRDLLLETEHLKARGNCNGLDTDLFFPERGGPTREAQAVCNGDATHPVCPVKAECLEYGLSEKFGIWGGLTERQRRPVRSARKAAGTPVAVRMPVSHAIRDSCPSPSAYRRHLRNGEDCTLCKAVHAGTTTGDHGHPKPSAA